MAVRIAYWGSTLAFLAIYAASVFNYITMPVESAAQYQGIGYPAYLVSVMIYVKIAGILAVLVRRPVWLAQLAYAGFFYHLLLAASAHIAAGIPGVEIAIVLIVLMLVSWGTQNVARTPDAAYVPGWAQRFVK